jgi:hypothetical protein
LRRLVTKWRVQKGPLEVFNPLPVQGVGRDPHGWKVSTILLFSNGEERFINLAAWKFRNIPKTGFGETGRID